jgi:prepilin-type N-terminal cleavage/methylation domain-containing protein
MSRSSRQESKGFTLIELLIVIGILGILAAIILVAVDPAKRLKDSRDARRSSEVNSILNAVLNYVVDNKGAYPANIDSAATSSQIIGTNSGVDSCGGLVLCNEATGSETVTACADLTTDLVDTYIGEIPVDPRGVDINVATGTYTAGRTGYWINKTTNGRIQLGSCNHEGTAAIKLTR